MNLPRTLKTASFRLAFLHLSLSVISVAIVAFVVLWQVQASLQDQLRARLFEASRSLIAQFEAGGPDRVKAIIEREGTVVGELDFRFEAPDGVLVAGALPGVPRVPGWVTAPLAESSFDVGNPDAKALILVALPPGGYLIAVGEELRSLSQGRWSVLPTLVTALLVMTVLGAVGGVILSAVFLRRVQRIAEVARGVIIGDLSRRIPVERVDDEFGWLATVLNHMLDRMANLVELNRQIGSALAHDLRSPLTRLLRRLEGAQTRGHDIEGYETALDGAVDDVNGILDTFNGILRIAQVEAGTRRSDFQRLDVGGIARHVVEAYLPVAQDESKELTAALDDGLWIRGDRELLIQLVVNLVENAIRHTPGGIRIALSGRVEGEAVVMRVSDDGPGIPVADRTRVLERFVRLDPARSTPGSGLGLTLCAAIADLHDAKFRLEDNGPGLSCVLRFPADMSMR